MRTAKTDQLGRTLRSDGAHAQPDLSLCWAHRSFCWFCYAAALSHILEITFFEEEKKILFDKAG